MTSLVITTDAPTWITLPGTVVRGHRVASQASEHYPQGTLEMQMPFFRDLGLDLSPYYLGTLNISIAPRTFVMRHPRYTFPLVEWTTAHPPETFSFSPCRIVYRGNSYEGLIYYPHPETKKRHFQNPSLIEVIAQQIPGLEYDATVELQVKAGEVEIYS